jgi:hypothetical protein
MVPSFLGSIFSSMLCFTRLVSFLSNWSVDGCKSPSLGPENRIKSHAFHLSCSSNAVNVWRTGRLTLNDPWTNALTILMLSYCFGIVNVASFPTKILGSYIRLLFQLAHL